MNKITTFCASFSIVFLLSVMPLHAWAQTSLQEIIQLAKRGVAAKQYQQVYEYLSRQEDVHGGNPEFNYYLGVAALESGKPSEAVFAFERALQIRPEFLQARADLGRAYFFLGENRNAKVEFTQVRTNQATPAAVSNQLDDFLAAIDSRFDTSGQRLEFYLATAFGEDSNINAATEADEASFVILETPISLPLSEDSQATESAYTQINPGVRFSRPLSENLNFFALADYSELSAKDVESYSSRSFNFSNTLAKLAGANRYQFTFGLQSYELTEQDFKRDAKTLSTQWLRTVNAQHKLTSFLSFTENSYPDNEDGSPTQDGNSTSLGFNWLQSTGRLTNYYGIYFGSDEIDDETQQHQAKDYTGLKLGTRTNIGQHSAFVNVIYQENTFAADDPLQVAPRDALFTSYNIGFDFKLTQKLTLSPKFTSTENATDAGLVVFDYQRDVLDINLLYNF